MDLRKRCAKKDKPVIDIETQETVVHLESPEVDSERRKNPANRYVFKQKKLCFKEEEKRKRRLRKLWSVKVKFS